MSLRSKARAALRRAERALATPDVLAQEGKAAIGAAMREHDMVDDPDEAYYRERYEAWIGAELGDDLAGSWLDAGCGSGRLLVPLARRVERVVGVDFLGEAIEAARRHTEGLDNVELHEADLHEFLASQPDGAYRGALFLEVGFVMPRLEEALAGLARVIEPGGRLLASFRSRLFLVQYGVRRRDWELVDEVMVGRAGDLPGMGWQNWSSGEEARSMLEAAGFTDVSLSGVGAASGIEGDPLEHVARPSHLAESDRAALARVEEAYGHSHPDIGRYILASARRAG